MGFRNDGQYTQITNGTTVLATATDGSVRQIILGVSGFSAGLTTNGREVMTGADGNQMDTESFLASLHVLLMILKIEMVILLLLLVKKFLRLVTNMVKVSYLF
jgi:hypothetical protein